MDLSIIIGNSNIKLGYFKEHSLKKLDIYPSKEENRLSIEKNTKNINVASVFPTALKKLNLPNQANIVTYKDIPIKYSIANPGKVGVDRLLNVFGALITNKTPSLVIDLGTATTFSFIDGKNRFQGGFIIPGIDLSLESLSSGTAQIPKFSLNKKISFSLGKDSKNAVQKGLFWAHYGAIEAIIGKLQAKYGTFQVIFTGGKSTIYKSLFREFKPIFDSNLQLKALDYIHTREA